MPKYVSRRKNEEEEEEEKETRSKHDFHPEPITLIKAGNCDRATIRTSHGSKINGRALHHFHRTRTVWLSHTLISPPTSLYPRRGSAKPRVKERGCHVRGRRPPVALRVISWRWTRDKLRAPSNRTSESRSGRNCVNIFRNDSLGRFDGRISNPPTRLSRSFDRVELPGNSLPFCPLFVTWRRERMKGRWQKRPPLFSRTRRYLFDTSPIVPFQFYRGGSFETPLVFQPHYRCPSKFQLYVTSYHSEKSYSRHFCTLVGPFETRQPCNS